MKGRVSLLVVCKSKAFVQMEPTGFTASIITIVQLTSTVVGYLNDVKDAPKDRAQCATEASNLFSLLTNLKYRVEESQGNHPWYTAVRALAIEGGPFDQYKSTLEQLQPKVGPGCGIRKIGTALVWSFGKQEVKAILSRMEHLKTLVQIALEMDHLSVFIVPQERMILTASASFPKHSKPVWTSFTKTTGELKRILSSFEKPYQRWKEERTSFRKCKGTTDIAQLQIGSPR